MNHCTLFGRLTRDPETKYLQSGQPVTNFSVATGKKWKDKNGEKKEKTEFHNCQAWGKLGEEVIQKYFKKGDQILLQGEIQYQTVEKDGAKTYYTKINVTDVNFVGSNKQKQDAATDTDSGNNNFVDSDIPF